MKEISPQEAYDTLRQDAGAVYIDVRTVEEFAEGHPEGAVNIPIAFHDPAQGMVYNHEFVEVVERHYAKERKLLLGCKAGPRSNSAANLLEQMGYQDVASVTGGFGGMRDPYGQVVVEGWAGLGLPVSQENGEGTSYESLADKR
ncbi:MAG: rhodanese-like domain-containing protein [Deltaproteobacteria bacterium]|nr:rhodanese-like domain-containing protein [Deltaproteobacteria bacterium]MDE0343337.1 rhodanese-like domain-containing protein [Deltaproteobacteria bacterium]